MTGTNSNAGKQTPRRPIPMRAPRATAIQRRTELLAVILYIQLYYIILYTIIYRAPGVANGNIHFLLHAAVHPGLSLTVER